MSQRTSTYAALPPPRTTVVTPTTDQFITGKDGKIYIGGAQSVPEETRPHSDEDAATLIQAGFRGMVARRSMQAKRDSLQPFAQPEPRELLNSKMKERVSDHLLRDQKSSDVIIGSETSPGKGGPSGPSLTSGPTSGPSAGGGPTSGPAASLSTTSILSRDEAAAKIQAGFRGMKMRKDSGIIPKTKGHVKSEIEKEVTKLAPNAEEEEEEEEVDIDLTDPQVEKTALMMQKKFKFGKKK